MPKLFKFATLAAFTVIGISPVCAATGGIVATVNGVAIPQARMDVAAQGLVAQGKTDTPGMRKAIRKDLITLEVVAQTAVGKGLNKDPLVAQQLELARERVLDQALVKYYLKRHPISTSAVKKEYENLKVKLRQNEYKVAQILTKSKHEARAIEAQLRKGGRFDKIARKKSIDTGSAKLGGEIGWIPASKLVSPFSGALMAMNKGQISAPIKSKAGWHILKLENVRPLTLPSYAKMKSNLLLRLRQQAVQRFAAGLVSRAHIK